MSTYENPGHGTTVRDATGREAAGREGAVRGAAGREGAVRGAAAPGPDVVVVGGGPVGLMLAGELALGGARVTVVERRTTIDPTIKAGSLTLPTTEALYRRGLLPELAEVQERLLARFTGAAGAPAGASGAKKGPGKFGGHFAGIMLRTELLTPAESAVPAEVAAYGDHGPAATISLVPQQEVERVLAEHAVKLGVTFREGVEVTGLTQDEAGETVTLTLRGAGGAEGRSGEGRGEAGGGGEGRGEAGGLPAGAEETLRTPWVVGCDGGRSAVRRLAGFAFPGTDARLTGHQALVEMTGAEALPLGWNWTPNGTYANGPHPGRVLTVEFDGPPADRERPVTAEEIQGSLRRVTGAPVTVTAVRTATRFTDHTRQAAAYREGRVLLAGDAAHVHPPFGGQGLNLGIGDAVNRGWKLAAVVRGTAPAGLLDSYHRERHPVGARVLDWTRAQVALMRTDPQTQALREAVATLAGTPAGATYFMETIAGSAQRVELGEGHPLTGRSAPDLSFADGSRLGDLLHAGRGLLLTLGGADNSPFTKLTSLYADRVDVHAADRSGRTGTALDALLIRPDGCVAWAADRTTDATTATTTADEDAARRRELQAALERWFGAPKTNPDQAP